MTLSKQLFTIISFIFIIIFVGNFVITVNNTKEYLEQESTTKAKDTAVSLGMILKGFIANKKDPEIQSTINVIADSGFYSSIVLKDLFFTFTDKELIQSSDQLQTFDWQISEVKAHNNVGTISISNDEELLNELNNLENIENEIVNDIKLSDKTYTFIANSKDTDDLILELNYIANNGSKVLNITSKIKLSKILVSSKRKIKFDGVPQWFINFIDIDIPTMSSQINDEWKSVATIFVSPNPGIAYKKLYDQVISALYYSIFSFIFTLILLYIFLLFILKPLNNIENLAKEISKGNYLQIKNIPWTTELKTVSNTMNDMSRKIENIINKLNTNIQNMNDKLNIDKLTKLPLKQEFETDLKKLFMNNSNGYIYLVKITNLMQYSKTHGAKDVDKFIISFAKILSDLPKGKAYRFFGSEFLIIFNNISEEENKKIVLKLQSDLDALSKELDLMNIANTGIITFDKYDTNTSILSNASEAYEMAKQVGPNSTYIKEKDENSMDSMKWRELVFDIIDNNKILLEYIGRVNKDDKNPIQEAFTKVLDDNNNALAIGTFLSVAQENNLAIKFDKLVISTVIKYISTNNISHQIMVNLSMQSILDVNFLDFLKNILSTNKDISKNLVFSLTAYSIASNKKYIQSFCEVIKQNNSNFMIKRYDTKFVSIEEMKYIKPTAIRLAREYTNKIYDDSSKQALVDAISNAAQIIDVSIYSENLTSKDDYDFLRKLDINVCMQE